MNFQFNAYSTFLFLPFIQGVLFSGLLICRTQDKYRKANWLLSFILLLMSIRVAYWMLGFAGWYDSHDAYTSFMFYFPFNTVCLVGPLLYFYFLAITNQNFRFEKKHLPHLWLPTLWILLTAGKFAADFILYYPFPKGTAFQFGTKGPWAELDKTIQFQIIAYSSFLYYLWLTLKSYRAYRQYTDENFSLLENVDFVWLRNLLFAIATGVALMFLYQVANWVYPLSYKADWYSYLFLGLLIYYVSIKGYQVQIAVKPVLSFEPKNVNMKENLVVQKTTLPDLDLWVDRLTQLMEQEKPYLIPDLTLSQLAKKAKINMGLLSKIINCGFALNFNDFINSYRIREVIAKLEFNQHQTITLLGIALESGFNSKATFNRAFKKQTGRTPIAYLDDFKTLSKNKLNSPVMD